ncbi:MAG: asparaginase [Cyanobacteria bacterium P01_F01_bin.33]
MTFDRRASTPPLAVHLLREGIVESTHLCQAVVADARGRPLSVAGNSETEAFIRSSLKPFQALAAISSGVRERFGLTDKDLAIMCGSHQGSISHARQVFSMLWRADLEPEHLMCPVPYGKSSSLCHNCSGKHAGMLMAAKARGWSLHDYLDRQHPVQQLVQSHLTELLRMPAVELLAARDDCGAPTYQLQLGHMATLYAHLAAGQRADLEAIARAMFQQPEMVSGPGRFDTEVMKLTMGEVISKSGGEGIQCLSRMGEGLGLAIKVADGSSRAKYALALHLMRQLGWISVAMADELAETFCQVGPFTRLEVEGDISV